MARKPMSTQKKWIIFGGGAWLLIVAVIVFALLKLDESTQNNKNIWDAHAENRQETIDELYQQAQAEREFYQDLTCDSDREDRYAVYSPEREDIRYRDMLKARDTAYAKNKTGPGWVLIVNGELQSNTNPEIALPEQWEEVSCPQ